MHYFFEEYKRYVKYKQPRPDFVPVSPSKFSTMMKPLRYEYIA